MAGEDQGPHRSMDIKKATQRMSARGMDALLVSAPKNVAHVTGFGSLMGEMWYEAGLPTAWALVPATGSNLAMVVAENEIAGARASSGIEDVRGYPIWVDLDSVSDADVAAPDIAAALREARSARLKPERRPGFFGTVVILDVLRQLLMARGLLDAHIGLDLDFISQGAFTRLHEALPGVTFVDASPLLRELRSIKTPQEIAHLRTAVWVAEQGILAAVEGVSETTSHADIRLRFQMGALQAVQRRGVSGFRMAGASVRIGPHPWVSTPDATIRPGDQIMFDCGADVCGLHSDIARTFVYARANEAQRRIQSALVRAHDAALAAVRPGSRFCDVYFAGMEAMRAAGFGTYLRGHIGHSIGLDPLEETPVISAAEVRVLEPGMVLAVELPWYIDGIGGFQCEDVVCLTEAGFEDFNTLTRDLVVI
ncbi:MAG: aminopeptidase P family protein [Armatimonadetes bacterium]|nr:aminopeptidase P family protein [Armatimonadota bacterium]